MSRNRTRRRAASALTVCAIGAALLEVRAQTISVRLLSYTPEVITPSRTQPVLIEAEVQGRPTSATVEFNPRGTTNTAIMMRDDGTNGDRVAGDSTYSALLPAGPILTARTADDVNRVAIGFLDIFDGATRVFRGNLFIDVYTDDIGDYPVVRLAQFVQATSRLVNIEDAGFFTNRDITRITREFYRAFGDDYDFLNLIYSPMRFENRTHFQVSNNVRGIGLQQINQAGAYGSNGRLLGISQFPISRFYDGASTGYVHETGHQWINYLPLTEVTAGRPHWPLSQMASGVMGFSIGGAGGHGGTFNCAVSEREGQIFVSAHSGGRLFGDLDLYLMGLLPAEQVRSQVVFVDQTAAQSLQCNGQPFTGSVTRIDASSIVRAVGPREPPAGAAPNRFRSAAILVTRNGLASPEMMSLYSWMTERAEWRAGVATHEGFSKNQGFPFFVATEGRGALETHIDLGREDFAVTPEVGSFSGSSTTQSARIVVEPRGRSAPQTVSLLCQGLPAPAMCHFDPSAVVVSDGAVTSTLTTTTAGLARGTHTIMVVGTSGQARHTTAVNLTIP